MIKQLLVAIVFGAAVSSVPAFAESLYGPNGEYLGELNSNPYDANSVSNPYGKYGSPYSPTSVNNPYGQYGSPYSTNGAANPYTNGGPIIVGPNGYMGRLNSNPYDANSVSNPYGKYGSPYSPTSVNNPYRPGATNLRPLSPATSWR